jgi:hypothetical protein
MEGNTYVELTDGTGVYSDLCHGNLLRDLEVGGVDDLYGATGKLGNRHCR